MKRFFGDKTAFVMAVIGVGLMLLTIRWRINPAESSVVPDFLTNNPLGMLVILILFVTCMPVWIASVMLSLFIYEDLDDQYRFACKLMIVLQFVAYFLTGKLISRLFRRDMRSEEIQERKGSR